MFSVLFEVHPKSDQWENYLGYAKMLRPELEQIEGFVDNIRYSSLTREGWLLSLSSWRDEKSLIRWRTQAKHQHVQAQGRSQVFLDYHLRVGQITQDTRPPETYTIQEQRLDETEISASTAVVLVNAKRPASVDKNAQPLEIANYLGLPTITPALVNWDVFEAVLTPGDLIIVMSFRDNAAATTYEALAKLPHDARLRRLRIIRDYRMLDRRESPQYYP
ncbi:MAG: antibiotic biosynthesis monooxygenase [Pseudomonadota bacterium]